MGKSVIYAANTLTQTVPVGGVVNFGTVVRKFGCNLGMSGGNIVVQGRGYYFIDMNITVDATDAGDLVVTLYKDGVAIPGATVTRTVGVGSSYAVSVPAVIRDTCDCQSTITAVVSGVATAFTNAAIIVEKL